MSDSEKDPGARLNMRQLLFANGVISGLTAYEAYQQAGYVGEGNSASASASKLLRNPNVAAYIAAQRAKLTAKAELTGAFVLERLRLEATGAAVDPVGRRMETSSSSRVAALTKLGDHLGLFQAARQNDADADADLLRDIRVRYALALHVNKGMPLEDAMQQAKAHPQSVEDWAVEQKLMAPVARA